MSKKLLIHLFFIVVSLKSMNLQEALEKSAFNPDNDTQIHYEKPLAAKEPSIKKERPASIRKAKSANDIGTISQEKRRNSFFGRVLASAASFFGRNSRNNRDKEMVTISKSGNESVNDDDN